MMQLGGGGRESFHLVVRGGDYQFSDHFPTDDTLQSMHCTDDDTSAQRIHCTDDTAQMTHCTNDSLQR
jgi:hypothetical protein